MNVQTQKSDINITPLIDIVLVLLIVFIIMVPSLAKALPAVIPQVVPDTEHEKRPPQEPVVVSLRGDGSLLLQQDAVSREDLKGKLVPALMNQPILQRKIFLKVDGELPHGQVVAVMDLLRSASNEVRKESKRTLGHEGEDTRIVLATLKKG